MRSSAGGASRTHPGAALKDDRAIAHEHGTAPHPAGSGESPHATMRRSAASTFGSGLGPGHAGYGGGQRRFSPSPAAIGAGSNPRPSGLRTSTTGTLVPSSISTSMVPPKARLQPMGMMVKGAGGVITAPSPFPSQLRSPITRS